MKKMFVVLLLLSVACGGKAKKIERSATVQVRAGQAINATDLSSFDGAPRIDAYGNRITFISGRDGGVLKAYKFDMSSQPPPMRVTNEDLGQEIASATSPDGKWVALIAEKKGTYSLYIVAFDSPAMRSQIELENDKAMVLNISFSSGAASLLAYELRSPEDKRSTIYVVSFSESDGSIAILTNTKIPLDSEEEDSPRWNDQDVGYQLVTRVRSLSGSKFIVRNFSDPSLSDVNSSILGSDIYRMLDTPYDSGTSGIYFATKVDVDSKIIQPETDKAPLDESIGQVSLQESVQFLSEDGSTFIDIESKQIKINSISTTRDAKYALVAGFELFECQKGRAYGSSLLFYNLETRKIYRLVAYLGADDLWQLGSDVCTRFISDPPNGRQPLDLQIQDALLGVDASSANVFNFTYQTWHSGDQEIRYGQFTIDEEGIKDTLIKKVSKNPEQ